MILIIQYLKQIYSSILTIFLVKETSGYSAYDRLTLELMKFNLLGHVKN